jgi:hypothetical protein
VSRDSAYTYSGQILALSFSLRNKGHTFGEGRDEVSEMIRLLERTFAYLGHVAKVLAYLFEQLQPNRAFTMEEPVQWILIICRWLGERVELLNRYKEIQRQQKC